MKTIDQKIEELRALNGDKFLYIEENHHDDNNLYYKIDQKNPKFAKSTIVLKLVCDGIEASIDCAIAYFSEMIISNKIKNYKAFYCYLQ